MTLRDQLAKKRAHSTSLSFPLGEDGEAAKVALQEARGALQLAVFSGNQEAIRAAEERRGVAQAAYLENAILIQIRGLTTEERDTLASSYVYGDDVPAGSEKGDINVTAYLPAALSVCALDSDMSEEDWALELKSDRWTAGERHALFVAVATATSAEPAPGIPKG